MFDNKADVPAALEALQSQLTDLKEQIAHLGARPAADAALENAVVDIADLFANMRLACFSSDSDVRHKIARVTAAAKVIRDQRDGRVEGKAA